MAGGLLGQGYNGGSLFGDHLFGGYPGLSGSPMASGMPLNSYSNQVSMLDYIFSQGQGLLGSMGQGLFSGGYGQSNYGGLF